MIPSQLPNQSLHPTPPVQPAYNFNQSNGMYPYCVDQYGSKISFQGLLNSPILNTPVANAQFESSTKRSRKKSDDIPIMPQAASSRKEWTKEEDVALTNAWLHVSMDSDIGNNQKSTSMWVRIVEVFKENMGARCNPLRIALGENTSSGE
ncbi:unnamed protein product [Cuscuta europaea]|uniref:Myb-like domain-containing protein n=1 Tax=Cuscuta europaea TaxID=41803 RepID=A0A9P0YGW5_CUSEU|nr:unnamed protein product [Cuscuta europaea]